MSKTVLNGITWGHSRGITPLLAASQRFSELHPGVEIHWKKRTLQEFADFPIEKLTEQYDLLIIDHPWVGCAAATGCVLPLNNFLSKEFLQDQLNNSVGGSHQSYNYEGHQWALAVDAATPAASYRADLFKKNNAAIPTTWDEVIALAKQGKIAVPAIPIDILMNFYMFCIAHGAVPFLNNNEVIDEVTGIQVLETMRQLYAVIDKSMFSRNPIAVAEVMTKTDEFWYCPFAYCYSNYSRDGYARATLTYADLINYKGEKLRSTIGGTGLAVSTFSKHKETALKFTEMVASGRWQSTLYVEHGGQPAHLSAWTNKTANILTNNFFHNVFPAMQNGFIRPRYNGYLYFQDHAGDPLHAYLLNSGDAKDVLTNINKLYKQSLAKSRSTVLQ